MVSRRQKQRFFGGFVWPRDCSNNPAMTNAEVFPIAQSDLVAKPKSKTQELAPQSDHALAIKAGEGDMGAFEQLYERHNRRVRSEEHTSELQSQSNLVCRL